MTAVAVIIQDALGLLRVCSATEAPEAEDAQTAIRALNAMMAAWAVDGWDLGWVDVRDPADPMPTGDWADEAITYNLAMRLRARYGVSLEQDVIALAGAGMATVSAWVARKDEADNEPRVRYDDLPAGVLGRRGDFMSG